MTTRRFPPPWSAHHKKEAPTTTDELPVQIAQKTDFLPPLGY